MSEREFSIVNLLVRIHFIIVMIRWTGLAPWEFEFPFPGSLRGGAHHLPSEEKNTHETFFGCAVTSSRTSPVTGFITCGGKGWFINSQTRPLHASEEDETRRQGSNSP